MQFDGKFRVWRSAEATPRPAGGYQVETRTADRDDLLLQISRKINQRQSDVLNSWLQLGKSVLS